jgi:hypothetical protein
VSTRNKDIFNSWSADVSDASWLASSIPTIPAIATRQTQQQINQIRASRNRGIFQSKMASDGTINEAHTACTETSALVGGNQPQSPHSVSGLGIGTFSNCKEAKTRAPVARMAVKSLIKFMGS